MKFTSSYRIKRNIPLIILFLLLMSSTLSYGSAFQIKNKRGQIRFSRSLNDWKHATKILGFDDIFIKHSTDGKRTSTISVTMTGKKIELVGKALKSRIDDYKSGRKKWAKKKNIKIRSFQEYKLIKLSNGVRLHKVGFNYSTKFIENVSERSIYINCPDDLIIHVKALLVGNHSRKESSIMNFLKSIKSCSASSKI